MKHIVPFHHLTDTQYLLHFVRLHRVSLEKYKSFCQFVSNSDFADNVTRIQHENAINIIPYLFTSIVVDTQTFLRFLMYCSRYLDLPNFHTVSDPCLYLMDLLNGNVADMIIIILLMQYYFL